MELTSLKLPELPSEACPYALSVVGALIRMSQASQHLLRISTEESSHEFVQRLLPVSLRTRTHFPLHMFSVWVFALYWLFMASAFWVAIYSSCYLGGYFWLLFSWWLFMAPVFPVAMFGSCSPDCYLWILFSW